MSSTYIYIRKTGIEGTKVMKMTRKEAMGIIRQHRGSDYQIGILGGKNLRSISMVYGEFMPYFEVERKEDLLNNIG